MIENLIAFLAFCVVIGGVFLVGVHHHDDWDDFA
jgi:hypothetical protein